MKKFITVRIKKTKPADINISWDDVETITSFSARETHKKDSAPLPCTIEEAEQAWSKIKRECGEFANTLLDVGQEDEFSTYIKA